VNFSVKRSPLNKSLKNNAPALTFENFRDILCVWSETEIALEYAF